MNARRHLSGAAGAGPGNEGVACQLGCNDPEHLPAVKCVRDLVCRTVLPRALVENAARGAALFRFEDLSVARS